MINFKCLFKVLLHWFLVRNKRLMNMRNDTTSSNCSTDQTVQLLISSHSKLQMYWGDSLHLQIFWRISCKFQHFSGQVLKNSCRVNSGCYSNSVLCIYVSFEQSMNTSDWKLQSSSCWFWLRCLFSIDSLSTFSSFASFSCCLC